jgi:hypothetical protein
MLAGLVVVLRVLLAGVLMVAATGKVMRPDSTLSALGALGLPSGWSPRAVRAAVVVAECGCVGLLVGGPGVVAGSAISALFAGFATVVVVSARRGGRGCGCLPRFRRRERRAPLWWRVAGRLLRVGAGGVIAVGASPRWGLDHDALAILGAGLVGVALAACFAGGDGTPTFGGSRLMPGWPAEVSAVAAELRTVSETVGRHHRPSTQPHRPEE